MATSWLKPLHVGKGRSVSTAISDIIGYVDNPAKTDNGKWITGYGCDTRIADKEFTFSKSMYLHQTGRSQGKRDVIAYHTRQSFPPGEITPEEANRMGYELAMRFTKGKHAFVVCTHVDKSHIHNHVIFNSTALDYSRKFRNFWGSSKALRRLNDQICLENGYSIIQNPGPREKHYGDWLGDNRQPSKQQKLRAAIDAAIEQKPQEFEDFLRLMEAAGYTYRRGKRLTFYPPGRKEKERGTRCDTLKGDYTEQAIRERIAGVRAADAPPQTINLLIDIQSRITAGKGPGYERWARVFNLKEAAKTLIFLQENGLTDYADLERRAADASARFQELSGQIKQVEGRMREIATLQKHIGNYRRTREVYKQYREAGYSKKFRADHEADIILHQASKKAFDALGVKKLPPFQQLKQEYAALAADKKKLYGQYREAREEMKNLLTVKANTDKILSVPLPQQDKNVQR